jgi:hypothetical protein
VSVIPLLGRPQKWSRSLMQTAEETEGASGLADEVDSAGHFYSLIWWAGKLTIFHRGTNHYWSFMGRGG